MVCAGGSDTVEPVKGEGVDLTKSLICRITVDEATEISAECDEEKVTMIVMDKTGTLTEGKPRLMDVLSTGAQLGICPAELRLTGCYIEVGVV